ncbi:NADH-quinone oxidoreductase subunit NuoH [Myceligenerans xiligouense]|uniref:NADH-quinone oxidoreductase subunit H n=1 Tax=Myceligenerans xiligouense TaxID=253184 RepID=A0A3N4ZAR2_9MICO|nr:NADH-quinone oxidoreductase subunit NuoH [Myceligenerans xiligouense]RPF22958.1 NADH dehydrogenase subunit H [Myceligenerans xiligouense]
MNGVILAAEGGVAADFSAEPVLASVVKAVLIVVFLLTSVLFAIWFERKVVAKMQLRPGPNWHGPKGLLQSLADAMKLLLKEDVNVTRADRVVYLLAPMLSVSASLLVFAVIPFGPTVTIPFTDFSTPAQLTDFPVAVLYILAAASVGVYGIVLGGWSSGSTYPLLGAVRSTAQVISYELAMGLSLVSVFIMAGSMSTSQIVNSQTQIWWFIPLAPAFVVYIISMVGETNRLPFDLPEAEGELVSGYMTEYSSMKFAWFFLAEYINMLNVSAVAVTLFLGGWRAPVPDGFLGDALNTGWLPIVWFLVKVWAVMFFFVWVRGTLLRLRYDQFMIFGWKVLIPVALGWVVVLGGVQWALTVAALPRSTFLYVAAGVVVLVLLPMLFWPEKRRRPEPAEPETIDAFAGGYPVPPLPGQKLPASERFGKEVAGNDR